MVRALPAADRFLFVKAEAIWSMALISLHCSDQRRSTETLLLARRQTCLQVDCGAAVGALHAREGADDVEDLGGQPSRKLRQTHQAPLAKGGVRDPTASHAEKAWLVAISLASDLCPHARALHCM